MSEAPESKPKLIVDDDWKERVQAEKAAFEQQSDDQPAESVAQHDESTDAIPAPSFPLLVSTLATQALVGLGQIPDPVQDEPVVRTDLAKHHIDMLGVIEEKTKGNLTPEESMMLSSALHDLRMLFVEVSRQASQRTEET